MTDKRLSTKLIHTRGRRLDPPIVNPPVERASTVLFTDPDALYDHTPSYGRMGLAVHRELEAGLAALEGARHVRLAPNGLAACALAIGALVSAGDHVLMVDTLYGPTRRFCERRLAHMGVSVTRFHPRIDEAGLAALIGDDTRLIMLESPGSLTFECPDLKMIQALAAQRGLVTVLDNTWSAGVCLRPLALGIDVSVQALTKYVVGHADSFGGAVMTNSRELARQIQDCSEDWGIALGPEEAYVAVRGLRTLGTRLPVHEATGYKLADWLSQRQEVACVLHPGRPDHADHALWARDFDGATGLFGFVLKPTYADKVPLMLKSLELFGMGFSWGGYESLLIPADRQLNRTCKQPATRPEGPLLRVHAGLEDPEDLIVDLETAFAALT